jgi:hypothetical protein
MHRLFVLLIALIALAGGTLAWASSPGDRSASVYALVDPNGGSPRLVTAHTDGFIAVSAAAAGDYCLTPAQGVDVADPAAVASEEAFYSDVVGFAVVRYDPTHANCTARQLEVKTFVDTPTTALSDQIAFTVDVPQSQEEQSR